MKLKDKPDDKDDKNTCADTDTETTIDVHHGTIDELEDAMKNRVSK